MTEELERTANLTKIKQLLDISSILNQNRTDIFNYKIAKLFNYFNFIPKKPKSNENNVKLAVDLKCHLKSITIKSYILGLNLFYFLLILDTRRNIVSTRMLANSLITLTSISLFQLIGYSKIFKIMNVIYRKPLEMLESDMSKENLLENFEPKVYII